MGARARAPPFGLIFDSFMGFFDCFMAFLIVFRVFGRIPYFACIWAILLYFCSPALSEAGTPWRYRGCRRPLKKRAKNDFLAIFLIFKK